VRRALTALVETLEQIRDLLPADKSAWDGDLSFVWPSNVCGSPPATVPKSTDGQTRSTRRGALGRVGRLPQPACPPLPGDLSSDRIWTDTSADLEPILAEFNRLR
jgi:hypothetical protein